ncbi:MAG: hypothetical protein MRECE_38c005 [Mycoplasmataceae bacterium CE_OT135]|nr:MAG: hypothetical protein MRECE_38c005 [Mycoplasmataceae bacterium CE_OT135]
MLPLTKNPNKVSPFKPSFKKLPTLTKQKPGPQCFFCVYKQKLTNTSFLNLNVPVK